MCVHLLVLRSYLKVLGVLLAKPNRRYSILCYMKVKAQKSIVKIQASSERCG